MAHDQDYALPRTGAHPREGSREEERVDSRTLFGQVMGLVAITCAFAAVGAYIGRDLKPGVGFGAFGAYGYATRRDFSNWARALFWSLLGLIGFGLITLFIAIPGGNVIYAVLGLVLFSFYTIFDFNRLKRASDMRIAPALAASIFLDIFNIFLFMLSLLGGGRR